MDQALIFFFIDTPTTEISPLSLHAALPISRGPGRAPGSPPAASSKTSSSSPAHERAGELAGLRLLRPGARRFRPTPRSEEHTSELPSQSKLGLRLLLGKKRYDSRA